LHIYSEESLGGILFTSSAEKVDKRTSLVLFGDKLQKFEDSFTIGFDLSIWDANQFGHIFRVINKQKQEVEFVFVNFYGIDSMYLDFHSPITHKSVRIPITKEDVDKKKTLHVDIRFDLKEDKASVTLRDSTYTCTPVGLENPSYLQFSFGLYGLNLDVPQMLIGNLHIQEGKDKSFFFPLEESKGEFTCDKTGKIKAKVKNPGWIINKHFYWQEKSSFRTSGKASVTFDEADNRIVISGGDSALSYYPRYDRVEIAGITRIVPVDEQHLLHSNVFCSSAGDRYQFGGYSNHSYSDRISRYDKETRQWEALDFKGDRITPRFYSAVGDGVLPDEKLIFGGFGNETGKQEHSGHNFYDLYALNLKQKTITNLWRLHEMPAIEFIPGNNLILSENKKYFYAFCYAHHIPKTFGYLYRFDLQNGKYDLVSDSINFSSEGMNNTSVNLFYNKEMHEFYVVIRDFSDKNETRVLVYSLLSPSITKSQLENAAPSTKPYRILAGIAALIAFLAVAIVFVISTSSITKKPEVSRLPREDEYDGKVQKQSAAYIFGAFTVYDRKGVDITYRFRPQLKVLFSLVLLNTKDETGISTEKLTQTLWPDKGVNEAKSARGIAINRLRNVLKDIGDIRLVHQNSQWFFTFDRSFYCDYLAYTGLLNRLQHAGRESYPLLMEQLHAIVRNGSFLLSIHDAGIDRYKSKEEEKLERLLKEYIFYLYKKKQYQKIISISATFFAIEPLNEEILNICIKTYDKLGKKEEAKTFLKNYKRTYHVMTGEKYKPMTQDKYPNS
jgi:two-component SAPR family response regulator